MKKRDLDFLVRLINALWIFGLAAVLLSGCIFQFTVQQNPCGLCMLQRLGMLCVAIGPMLNLRFGFNPLHYGISLCGIFFGGAVSLRQMAHHIANGSPIFGQGICSCSFLTFAASLAVIVLLLFLYPYHDKKAVKMHALEILGFALMIAIAVLNAILAFMECGLGIC